MGVHIIVSTHARNRVPRARDDDSILLWRCVSIFPPANPSFSSRTGCNWHTNYKSSGRPRVRMLQSKQTRTLFLMSRKQNAEKQKTCVDTMDKRRIKKRTCTKLVGEYSLGGGGLLRLVFIITLLVA